MSRVAGHAEVVTRLRARLQDRQPARIDLDGYRPAAVAVMLIDRGGETHLPLIVRAQELRAHSGQVAFPGGVRDATDASSFATAGRESHEELGIDPGRLELIGDLDDLPTPTHFVITPVVCELRAGPAFVPNPAEVAGVFEAPLALFCDPGNIESLGRREFHGIQYELIAFRHQDKHIWGATARILRQLGTLAALQ